MNKLNGTRLSYVELHSTAFVPDLGNIGKILSAFSTPTTRPYDMVLDERGSKITITGEDKFKRACTFEMPITSVFLYMPATDAQKVMLDKKPKEAKAL